MTNFYTNKKQIIDWLDEYKVTDYFLIPDDKYGFAVDVDGNVALSSQKLTFIPVKFNSVAGSLFCFQNELISLEFCPQHVGGKFHCQNNPGLKEIQKITDFNLFRA